MDPMLAKGLCAIGACFAVSIGALGGGIGMGIGGKGAFESIARQPEVAGDVRTLLFIVLAFIETLTIYGLLIAFMLFGKIGAI
ncbi:MAG: ATP synthase F0 subunit C [Syntrophomonadaceae bacterium]|nr:ATP synthase F0 subunit C [Syntrophomonadaceae bacterium]